MKKTGLAIIIAIISILSVQAQQKGPNIAWDNPSFDFKDIKEQDGNVSHKFTFSNTGNQPLVITNVRPSCGCTTSDYTKEPIRPGAKGYVSATFNPKGRPHKFNKSITITSNALTPVTTVRFTGNVIPKPKELSDEYPRKIGELNCKSSHIAFSKIKNTEVKTQELGVANLTQGNLNISFDNIPKHITIKAVPTVLKPNQTGKIIATYNAKEINDWGFIMDRIIIAINKQTNQNKNRLSISATVIEDFSSLSQTEVAKAPKIVFDNKVFNFGTIKQGEKITHNFKFKNEGKSDLIIRKTKTSCGCTVVSPSKSIIKAGESAEFKATFNSSGKLAKQNKSITITTNAPNESQVTLRITGTVAPAK